VSPFDRLHPIVQHHVVNSLGWRELRPLQEASIEPIMNGAHSLLLAPTAGGKTEAAFFPLLSRMTTETWKPVSVIYVCPLKALINNLQVRLERYCGWAGRTCAVWHGDVLSAQRSRMLTDLPDCLLTTPESLEAMLISTRVEHRNVFANVRAVVIDELHAFAGDDRGWHMLAVLERVTHLSGREIQRIGLSATIGNPNGLLDWLAGHCIGPRELTQIESSATAPQPMVQVDFVGSLENAARVIATLHAGEKRLVFCDSRSRVEQLALNLRGAGIETYVSHSSLSADERRRAELAFAEGANCVIVATSTLELGIDVGDLDRVIQIDAPSTVASFLQRLGRTGRRTGTPRNCLFLALTEDSLRQSIAIVKLWQTGYVEPVQPPPQPIHLLAQQLIALILQERILGKHDWRLWIGRLPAFGEIAESALRSILRHLVSNGYILEDQDMWMIGPQSESELGRRHFSDLVSVFTSPPLFEVWNSRQHVGNVEETALRHDEGTPTVISLGGHAWRVTQTDWRKRRLEVVPEPGAARTRWLGTARTLRYELCQMIYAVLREDEVYTFLSKRARASLEEQRNDFAWVRLAKPLIRVREDRAIEWWTFAGRNVNQWICDLARELFEVRGLPDDFRVRLDTKVEIVHELILRLHAAPLATPSDESFVAKFSDLLPETERTALLQCRAYRKVDLDNFIGSLRSKVK
jgi:ATP-dependent Lhr-like helicase